MLTHLPTQDRILLCATFLHIPRTSLLFSLGTELEQHCMTPNTAFPITSTHVSSVLKSINFLWLHRQMGTHYRRAPSSHCALLCLSPHCPLTVPHCAVLALVSLVPGVWRLTCAGAGSASWQHPASSSPARAQQVHHHTTSIPHLHHPASASHTGESFRQQYSILVHRYFQISAQLATTALAVSSMQCLYCFRYTEAQWWARC